jgi:hypothetical protein
MAPLKAVLRRILIRINKGGTAGILSSLSLWARGFLIAADTILLILCERVNSEW